MKKDGISLPKQKETMTLEEYEEMKIRMGEMEAEIAALKASLEKLSRKENTLE